MESEALNIVKTRIAEACEKAGRDVSEVTLVAVSKTHPPEVIKEIYSAGQLHFGENKAQEFRDKTPELPDDILWHFIGHLQRNKVKYVIDKAEYIHSVDSVKLAAEINKRAGQSDKIQKIFLEINTSGESSKYGLEKEDLIKETADFCKEAANIELAGLMTMAPYDAKENEIREYFARLRNLRAKLNSSGYGIKELSMGMSNDFEAAIAEGSTMVRVGSAIFGERDYNKR